MTRTEALDLRKKVVDGETHEALRPYIEKAAASLDDNDAANAVKLFPAWSSGIAVSIGERYQYADKLYKVVQEHTTQADWTPEAAPSLWAEVLIPDPDAVPEWEQPDSTNPYSAGDKVTHNGKTWVSDIDNNVWEPGVYGWSEVST